MPFFRSLPSDAAVPHIFALRPDVYGPFNAGNQALMRGESPLSIAQRELIGAYTSALNACQYCAGGHRVAAELFGIEPQVLDELVADLEGSSVEPKLKPLLAFIRKLTETPSRMVQADADAVFDAGWDERALHDAIAVSCFFSFMNRLVLGHGIVPDPDKFVERGRRHFELGYLAQHPELYSVGGEEAETSARLE